MSKDDKSVLLPQAYVTKEMELNALLKVFLYTDSEDRLVATTLTPHAFLDEFAIFSVVDTAPFGAFVNWGLPKDLFVPSMFQKEPFRVGEKKFLQVVYDEKTHRLVGTQKSRFPFDKRPKGLFSGSEVEILLTLKTPLGFKCLVDERYEGLIYQNEIFETVGVGDKRKAFVTKVRPDGSLDLNLQAPKAKGADSTHQKILSLLENSKGSLPYNYKSDPELIHSVFGLSKKAYKAALTALQEKKLIEVKDTGIYKLR